MGKGHEVHKDGELAVVENGRPSSGAVLGGVPTVEHIINMLAKNNELLRMKTTNSTDKMMVIKQNDQLITRLKGANGLIRLPESKIEEKLNKISDSLLTIAKWIKPTCSPTGPQIAATSNLFESNPLKKNKR